MSKNKKKTGRPRTSDTTIEFRCWKREKKIAKGKAKAAGKSLSEWLRAFIGAS